MVCAPVRNGPQGIIYGGRRHGGAKAVTTQVGSEDAQRGELPETGMRHARGFVQHSLQLGALR